MRLTTAVILGKFISYFIKLFKLGGGSAAPGLVALKICPSLIADLSRSISKNVVITGTNGKTTTAKMLAHFAKANNLKVIRNHTGSNLSRGIAATLIQNFHLRIGKKTEYDLGIWELDESAFNSVAPQLNSDIIIFLNVFRDQLDRYGEIDAVTNRWCQTLKKIPAKTLLLVNGDDASTAKIASCFKGKSQKFGLENYKISGENAQKKPEKLDFEAKDIKLNGLYGSNFTLRAMSNEQRVTLPIPGAYHIYDALAAIASASLLNLPTQRLTEILKSYSPAFGRVEKLPFGYIFLIKNPAGATAVFETIAPNLKHNDRLLLALNDNLADGTDVSWIWDAGFEKLLSLSLRAPEGRGPLRQSFSEASNLSSPKENNSTVYFVSGTRAHDLALRLKYAGVNPEEIEIEPDMQKALQKARNKLKGSLYILPTYTAMLELQSILTKNGIKKYYWESD